jgi:hypothetical protein
MKKAKLELWKLSIPNKITFGRSVISKMRDNANFADPSPKLVDVELATSELSEAADIAQKGSVASTQVMYNKEKVVDKLLTALSYYVEIIANQNPETAALVITSAGMEMKKQGSINIPDLSVKKGSVENSALLRRKSAGSGVAYKWQYCKDLYSEANWLTLGESTVAKFEAQNLQPLVKYWFRVGVLKGAKLIDGFSDPVSFVVF